MNKRKRRKKITLSFKFKTEAERKAFLERCADNNHSYDSDVRLGALETFSTDEKIHKYPPRD